VVVSEITTGDHSKGANGRERAGLRAAQGVLAIAVAHDLAFQSARQVEVTREHFTRVEAALVIAPIAVTFQPSRIVILTVPLVAFGVLTSRSVRTRTAPKRERVIVIAIAPIVVSTVPRIVAPARVIEHEHLA
jgi:hypothetical protein